MGCDAADNVAATTFLLLRVLLESVSSFCVGSTETFRGFPNVTRDEAMAIPEIRDYEENSHYLQYFQ